jgi:two-component system, NarL family, nitrate/nitrite response regulator NarL
MATQCSARALQRFSPGLETVVIAEGAGAEDTFRIAREYTLDVLILDLHPESSVEAVRQLASEFQLLRTIILTVVADEDQVVAALQAGAAGYMLKGSSGSELVESIRRVHQGECYVFPLLAANLIGGSAQRQKTHDRFSALTIREEQVLHHLTHGLSNKEIGRKLFLSEKTVKHYLTVLFDKLQVRNRVEAALVGNSRPEQVPTPIPAHRGPRLTSS